MLMRLATPDDAIALAELRWEHEYEGRGSIEGFCAKNEFVRTCSEHFAGCFREGTLICWLAEEGGLVVANIFIRRIRKVPKPRKLFAEIGYVTNVHTRASHRNRSVGTELLKRAIAWAREEGIEGLFVWPSRRSRPFYQRQGFSEENDIMELELS